ncbi:MAG: kynureninase [Candidatus Obscuribacterales bacterium]|nr:kynureninase [Candidatus Obscuribacterales bacterium]
MLTSAVKFENSEIFARTLDEKDELKGLRELFYIPTRQSLSDTSGKRRLEQPDGDQCIYLAGNSLGLQPKRVKDYICEELEDWAYLGVEGHFNGRHPWLPYHENVADMSARLVGAKPIEVVVMNTLTTNLHLMMVSFYQPKKERYKILVESNAFPSDQYAVASQAKFHGYNPADAIIELKPREGEETMRTEDILDVIEKHGSEIALILLGNVNYLTGQAFQVVPLAQKAHEKGCYMGLNLAHGAGNLHLQLHDWGVDFAVWCSYKYLNSGPGGLAGCFVHERHKDDFGLPRFAGWWGHNKTTRFKMGPEFEPLPGAEGWQLSNPPIFPLAALRASLELFDQVGMKKLREKGDLLTGYLEYLLSCVPQGTLSIITPSAPEQRGSQLSIRFTRDPKAMLNAFKEEGVICDFREPDIIRATPAPMYNTFLDVYRFAGIVSSFARSGG